MSLYNGILNLTNWAGNVIMPTLGALFIAIAILQFARGQHQVYSTWAYGGILCLLVSGLLRAMEKFTGQLGWNNPDLYWNSILNLVDWFANVILADVLDTPLSQIAAQMELWVSNHERQPRRSDTKRA